MGKLLPPCKQIDSPKTLHLFQALPWIYFHMNVVKLSDVKNICSYFCKIVHFILEIMECNQWESCFPHAGK